MLYNKPIAAVGWRGCLLFGRNPEHRCACWCAFCLLIYMLAQKLPFSRSRVVVLCRSWQRCPGNFRTSYTENTSWEECLWSHNSQEKRHGKPSWCHLINAFQCNHCNGGGVYLVLVLLCLWWPPESPPKLRALWTSQYSTAFPCMTQETSMPTQLNQKPRGSCQLVHCGSNCCICMEQKETKNITCFWVCCF